MNKEIGQPRFTALVYGPGDNYRDLMAAFCQKRRDEGLLVCGLLQEIALNAAGQRIGVDMVDIHDGFRYEIVRPSKEDLSEKRCGLVPSALCDAFGMSERAVKAGADLIIFEKFGERERNGEGLRDEIVAALTSTIPTLVAVSQEFKEAWVEFSGNSDDLLPCKEDALEQWWQSLL